ncbi:MAG: DinB family protein [Anaerolineales bacterium]|nr:DinB family protein [Anaerolineales bacterium]
MKELFEYRLKMIARLEQAAQEFCDACLARDAFAKLEGEWSAHQIAAHTRDVAKTVYGERIQRTLREENPAFENFDADAWIAAHYDKDEPLAEILSAFLENVKALCVTLSGLPNEYWSRESSHESSGSGLTLQLWVERSLAHIEEHLVTLLKPT